jgi:Uncharacterized protein conserved in bacteria (DUF2272)
MTPFGEFEDTSRFPRRFSPYRSGRRFEEAEYEFRQPARSYLGGYISTLTLSTLPVQVAVYCPKAAASQPAVEVLVYAHGLLRCPPLPKRLPEGFITAEPFNLGKIVDASERGIVLVVPFFDWKPGQRHALGMPANLNRLVAEVLDEVGAMQHIAPPSLTNLILAGHSRAYGFLEPLAQSHADPQMRQGALARLSEVWEFDTTYTCDIPAWVGWLNSKPNLKVSVFFRNGSLTQSCGWKLHEKAKESGGRLRVTPLDPRVEHCAVPNSELGGLLNPPGREREFEDGPLPLRQRIVETAEREWRNWGQGSVGEADPAATPLLSEYYRAAVHETVSPGQLQSKSWQNDHPWSAVFVSYVMRKAGAGDAFAYAAAHTTYVAAAKRAAARRDGSKFQAFRIDQAPIEAGDVVCRDRQDVRTGHCYGTTFENAESGGHSHGEIVMEVNPRLGYAVTIGGNTSQDYPHTGLRGNTVGKHKIPVNGRGFVVSRGKCAFFAVLKMPRSAPETELDLPGPGRWQWLSQGGHTERETPRQSGGGALTESRAVRITVIGHSSARWRGARNRTEADRLNDTLSNRRADKVRAFVEQILKQQVPNIPILPGTSPGPGYRPTGLQVGSYGVGSRQPVSNPGKIDPKENDPLNRSVQVVIELITTQYGVTGASRAPLRISARTDSWYGQVMSLEGAAFGVAGYHLILNIRNPLSDKIATYTAIIVGGGVGGPSSRQLGTGSATSSRSSPRKRWVSTISTASGYASKKQVQVWV